MDSFQVLNRDCVANAYAYVIKRAYLGISALSIFCVLIVLGRMWWRAHRKKNTTAIGRLIEHLVIVGACLDICFHLVDVLFALNCNAPPLLFLLGVLKADIYTKVRAGHQTMEGVLQERVQMFRHGHDSMYLCTNIPSFSSLVLLRQATIPFNIIKEGFGLLSLSWHAHLAYCIYSWIVLKRSTGRLQRKQLPSLVFTMAAITGVRLALFYQLREGMLGLFLSSVLYDVVLLPSIIAVMLRWYFLTISVLRAGHRPRQHYQHQQDTDTGRESMQVKVDLSRAQTSGIARDGLVKSLAASSMEVSTGEALPIHRSMQALPPSPPPLRQLRSVFKFPSLWSSLVRVQSEGSRRRESSSIQSASSDGSGGSFPQQSLNDGGEKRALHPQDRSVPLNPPPLSVTSTAPAVRTGTMIGSRPPPPPSLYFQDVGSSRQERKRNSSIIRRLLRISLSVALVWTLIAVSEITIWAQFYIYGDTTPIANIFLVRMVLMRMIGTVDAIMLGDLIILCLPCANVFARMIERLRCASASPHGAGAAEPSSDISISKGGSSVEREVTKKPESLASVNHKEDDMSRITQALDRIHRARAPTRCIKTLDIFVSTWNMGGVDHQALETSGFVTSLLPQWLPPGYSLYVLGVQECQCLREFREGVQNYLGGGQNFVMFGDELGDDQFLHGFIAITLFVQASDVASGAFRVHRGAVNKVAAGVSLGALGHAPNKGMVGLSCRYFDVSLAFVTAHFASDSKGRNRMGKRNKHACTTLRSLSLHDYSDDFEVHHQHHHQICLGDFNYRLSPASPPEILGMVARSAQQMQMAMLGNASQVTSNPPVSSWRKARFQEFFRRPPSFFYRLGDMPDLPPCLGMRHTSMASTISSGSWYNGAGHDLSAPGRAGGSYLNGVLPNLFAAKSFSSLTQGKAKESRGPSVAFSGVPTSAAVAMLPSYSPHVGTEGPITCSEMLGHRGIVIEGEVEQIENSGINPDPGPSSEAPITTYSVRPSIESTVTQGSEVGEAWEWVRRLDELSRSMRECAVFYDFVEAPITFPPSYRWNRSKSGIELAGDYTDLEKLWVAYSTVVVDRPKLLSIPRLPSFIHQSSVASSSTVNSPRNDTSFASPSPPLRSTTSSRTPSYTDRILTHSLPGKGANLRWRHYDMMDGVGLSDHRPVCAHLTLLADADCRGFRHMPPAPSRHVSSPQPEESIRFLGSGSLAMETAVDRDDLALFTISLSHPHVTLKVGSKLSKSFSSVAHEITVLFPLVSEDPLASERKASSLEEVMPGAGGARPAAGLLRGQSSVSSLSFHRWSSFPVKLKTVASMRFSEHLLFKLSDRRGNELGQTVIPVALGLHSKEHPVPPFTSYPSNGSLPIDEIGEGSRVGQRDSRRFRFPLTKGGALKGWITLTIKTRLGLVHP